MAEIRLNEPSGPYGTTIDTEQMNVEIRKAHLGVIFVSSGDERLAVSMRDSGFEVLYYKAGIGDDTFDAGWTEFKNGEIKHV